MAEGDLAVAGNGHVLAATNADDGGGVENGGILTGVHAASDSCSRDMGTAAEAIKPVPIAAVQRLACDGRSGLGSMPHATYQSSPCVSIGCWVRPEPLPQASASAAQ
ncbi:hypothetical protein D3C73_1485040 [compost metagenome]